MNVAVIGASNKPDRYSYKAVMLLKEKGHQVFPVHQRIKNIEGILVFPSIKDIPESVNTVSLYVSADISNMLALDIIAKKPSRIIFNPGTENPAFERQALQEGIEILKACTLVLLTTGQF